MSRPAETNAAMVLVEIVVMLNVPQVAGSVDRALLENVVELHPNLKTLVTEADVQPQKRFVSCVEAEAKPDVALHAIPGEVALAHEHLAGIREGRHIKAAEDFPAVLGVHYHQVVATEP